MHGKSSNIGIQIITPVIGNDRSRGWATYHRPRGGETINIANVLTYLLIKAYKSWTINFIFESIDKWIYNKIYTEVI